uniref:Olfactory receptor n=1 Tax=Leptobrachium leishanense TaxID=445787 RepID=A0A8C5M779_9ANUR
MATVMESRNRSTVTEFILLGFPSDTGTQVALFLLFSVVYVVLLAANIILILAVTFDHHLHNPMYFFLINLSIINIGNPSVIVPKMLMDFLNKSIVFSACVTQMFLHFAMGGSECLLLVFMAYDRYVAICKPLHYSRIMNRSVCALMATVTWLTSFVMPSLSIFIISEITFCGSNIINHFLCSFPSLMLLSCSDTSALDFLPFLVGATILLVPLLLILFSYYKIISSIKGIQSRRYKAFSSCTPHLIVVFLFYGMAVVSFMRPNASVEDDSSKGVSVFYVIITPLLNPMIYSLRNKDVIRALRKLMRLP